MLFSCVYAHIIIDNSISNHICERILLITKPEPEYLYSYFNGADIKL